MLSTSVYLLFMFSSSDEDGESYEKRPRRVKASTEDEHHNRRLKTTQSIPILLNGRHLPMPPSKPWLNSHPCKMINRGQPGGQPTHFVNSEDISKSGPMGSQVERKKRKGKGTQSTTSLRRERYTTDKSSANERVGISSAGNSTGIRSGTSSPGTKASPGYTKATGRNRKKDSDNYTRLYTSVEDFYFDSD
jgi:hypothetical protein